jgi:hypothetical protein
MIFYLLLCVISILTGQGILHLIGGHIERRISLYLAPVITLTLWAIVLGIGVSVGFPVKYLVVVTWAVTIVLIAIAIVRHDYSFIRSEWPLLLMVIFLPVCIMVVVVL